ncbi:MAG: DUF475 domain-containing protein, partial [Candidatus Saccharimonadales bacterium]
MTRYFGFSALLTVAAIVAALVALGPGAALTVTVLIAIEIAFSFDNAIINAKILERLSRVWQQLFLTIGMVFAIVGMRFVFPIVIVMATAHLPWSQVINEALRHPAIYGDHLQKAHASISAFGGSFLLVLTLYFLLDDAREVLWLKRIERPLQRIGGTIWLPPVLVAIVVSIISLFVSHESGQILRAGLFGVGAYTVMKLLIDGLGRLAPAGQKTYVGGAAFLAFMYL